MNVEKGTLSQDILRHFRPGGISLFERDFGQKEDNGSGSKVDHSSLHPENN